MSLKPSQCRAARALLGWSQDDLETKSGVSKKSIADFEREAQIPYDRTLRDLQSALEAGGVQIIAENGGGAGVRLRAAVARLTRKRVSRFDRVATIAVSYRGGDYQVQFSTSIIDDMDHTNHPSDVALDRAVDVHMPSILLAAAVAIDDGRADPNGVVVLGNDDFPEISSQMNAVRTRFVVGERYASKRPPHKVAEVVQVADEGRKAWVDVQSPEGVHLDSAWVVMPVFSQHWTLT